MKIALRIILIASAALLAGCQSQTATIAVRIVNREAEASGSPFRWEARSVPGGTALTRVMIDLPRGSTKAEGTRKRDILDRIEQAERSKQRGAPELEEVRLLPDGREVWILRQREGVAYVVTLQDGADFTLEGPTAFERKG